MGELGVNHDNKIGNTVYTFTRKKKPDALSATGLYYMYMTTTQFIERESYCTLNVFLSLNSSFLPLFQFATGRK